MVAVAILPGWRHQDGQVIQRFQGRQVQCGLPVGPGLPAGGRSSAAPVRSRLAARQRRSAGRSSALTLISGSDMCYLLPIEFLAAFVTDLRSTINSIIAPSHS